MSIVNPKEFRSNIIKHIDNFVNDSILSTNLEKAVFNYSIKEGTKKDSEKVG